MADSNPQRPEGVAAAFAPATVDSSATPVSLGTRAGDAGEASATADPSYALFFYGTLVHPAILAKVIGNAGAHVTAQPAILPGYALHHVKNEDYPGLVPQTVSDSILAAGQKADEAATPADAATASTTATRAVRGTLVRGLKHGEVRRLDAFEGDEYRRAGVHVLPDDTVPALCNTDRPRDASISQVLSSLTPPRIQDMLKEGDAQGPTAGTFANVYLWDASPLDTLDPAIWSFETFTASGKDKRWWSS